MIEWPRSLAINAWTGDEAPSSPTEGNGARWGLMERAVRVAGRRRRYFTAANPRDWADERVGWGLVLPDTPAFDAKQRAAAADAPEAIRALVAARGGPVFRWSPTLQNRVLARDLTDGRREFVAIAGAPHGIGPKALPQYLLIYGTPSTVPWSIQYLLNGTCFVGRLDLEGPALENYVNALLSGWRDAQRRRARPLVWAVDHGGDDITALMRSAIAEPLFAKWQTDDELKAGAIRLAGPDATAAKLAASIAEARPSLIVTTSHGATGPVGDAERMKAQLGFLVDQGRASVGPEVLADWQPDGAIWYAHACCSAGSDDRTLYTGLVPVGSTVDITLNAVAGLGARVAPLPRDLLGRKKPLAAFVGHVEPTFNWTLQQFETGQFLTAAIQQALYERVFQKAPDPIGLALSACYHPVATLLLQARQAAEAFGEERDPAKRRAWELAASRTQLMALDRQSMVILGDPTACLPKFEDTGSG